ncbi:hypothetical protein GCM10022408_07550 [Hymenobacter fastidiosus]|uniref:DUF58 domain-containing protein n=1 Tax=Hymenobacter fastidiosus TaxID=486264 RepID=A0ABP7RL73_9BACT
MVTETAAFAPRTGFSLLTTSTDAIRREPGKVIVGLRHQLPYLRRRAQDHLLLVVFFENTGLREFRDAPAATTEDIYHQTVAGKFAQEKRRIVRELQRYGIHALLTPPQDLTVNAINRYLEFKARGLI